MSTNSIQLPAFLEGAVRMESVFTIAADPEKMVPLVTGEYLHLGYEPLDESQAFHNARAEFHNPSPFGNINAWTLRTNTIRIPRETTTGERVVQLCHKFIYLNPGVDIIMPKRDHLNQPSRKSIFRCQVNYKTNGGKHAKIQLEVSASATRATKYEVRFSGEIPQESPLPESVNSRVPECTAQASGGKFLGSTTERFASVANENKDVEEYLVTTQRTYGSNEVHCQFFNHLRLYLESDGKSDPIMGMSLLTSAVFSTAPPVPIEPGMGWNEIVEYLQTAKPSAEEKHTIVNKVRGVKDAECKRRLRRLKDIRRLRREEGCSDDDHVEYYQDESDSESSQDGNAGYFRSRKSPYVKYEHLMRGERTDLDPASPPEKYDLETAEGIMRYIDHHSPYYNHLGKVLFEPLTKVFEERDRLRKLCTK